MNKLTTHLLLALLVASSAIARAQKKTAPVSLETAVHGTKHFPGLIPLDWDPNTGRLYLEISGFDSEGRTPEMLYVSSLPWGLGSSEVGFDRGSLSNQFIVRFEREGTKVLLVAPNLMFGTSSHESAAQLAVAQSFPESVLWGFKVVAASSDGSRALVDATDFYLHDAQNIPERIRQAISNAPEYQLDPVRSAIVPSEIKAFPQNTVVETELTFTAQGPFKSDLMSALTPDAHALTLRERQDFIALPPLDGTFHPRRFDPRSGYLFTSFRDVDAPLGSPLAQQFILRHRLIKKDPSCTTACVAVQPLQYYVDRGIPEPLRSSVIEGARWWDEAFQAAGWAKGTFRVDLLPPGADPMDVRYNIIQWVHRDTRGWSYGNVISDPHTGEILKGNVTLGSLRARQDYLLAEALLSPYKNGVLPPGPNPMLQMVLARMRQLAAHEVGHTLGLAHNFAASSIMPGDSVMDYPFPNITLDSHGNIDLSHAYTNGIGAWDKIAIEYGYRTFAPNADEQTSLDNILSTATSNGQYFISDDDSRPAGSAHPYAHLWDNGPDPADELTRILQIRSVALSHFGIDAIQNGTPLAQLEETLVPLYLLHRYQTIAAIKEIGGLDYRYSLRGDGQPLPHIVDPAAQRKALAAVLQTLTPETLTLPTSLLNILPPHPPGDPRTAESFPSHTGLTFDPIAAAESAADLTLSTLLDPARASRLIEYHMREGKSPSLRSVLEGISNTTAERPEGGHTMSSEVERAVELRGLEAMFSLAVDPAASSQARAITLSHIEDVLAHLTQSPMPTDTAEAIHRKALIEAINQFEKDPTKFVPEKPVDAPPGMPIGAASDF